MSEGLLSAILSDNRGQLADDRAFLYVFALLLAVAIVANIY